MIGSESESMGEREWERGRVREGYRVREWERARETD